MENLTESILIQAGLLKDYLDLFHAHHIESEVWVEITSEHLKAIGMSNSHHIKQILNKRDQILGIQSSIHSNLGNIEAKPEPSQDLSISFNAVVKAARLQTKMKTESAENVLKKVKSLDMSSKNLTSISNLTRCASLQMLSLSHNSIVHISGLEQLRSLRILNLESNLIQKIEGLATLTALEKCYLDYNYIKVMEGLENLQRLAEFTLNHQQGPGSLFIDENSVVAVSPSLRKLALAGNFIEDISNLWYLDGLVELDLAGNSVTFCEDLYKMLSCLRYLQKLKLAGNPVSKRPKYRDEMILWSHNLQELDDKNILANEKEYLFRLKGKRVSEFPKEKPNESLELEIKGNKYN
jgi:uncharacterized protein YehS (DUF1456 family)